MSIWKKCIFSAKKTMGNFPGNFSVPVRIYF